MTDSARALQGSPFDPSDRGRPSDTPVSEREVQPGDDREEPRDDGADAESTVTPVEKNPGERPQSF